MPFILTFELNFSLCAASPVKFVLVIGESGIQNVFQLCFSENNLEFRKH